VPDIYNNLPFYNRFEYIVQSLGFTEEPNAYLQYYLDEVFDFSRTRSKDIFEFLEHWEINKNDFSISTSETSNAVHIMTIHKSKGLQFPIVIYAYANFNLSSLNKVYDWIPLDPETYGLPVTYQRISNTVSHLNEDFHMAYESNVRKTELANMNTAYVCMTRAEDQLYVLVDPPVDDKNLDFRKLLFSYLSSKGMYEENQSVYYFGEKVIAKPKGIRQTSSPFSNLNSYKSSRFLSTLTPNEDARGISAEVEFGLRIHKVLEQIRYSSDYFEKSTGNEFKKEIEQILSNEYIKAYYLKPWQIFNEVEIAYNTNLLRIDRLCINANDAVIIDYKTGTETPEDIQQITNYKKAIESLGYTNIQAYLVYIRDSILVKPI
jgi:ATP-dependent exoDNAse (exonuclease V) beta subunit